MENLEPNVRALLEFDDSCWEPLDPTARTFVERLLEKKPLDRGTVAAALENEWLGPR